jgi:uncharacterized protein YicC (UPF0701 family)
MTAALELLEVAIDTLLATREREGARFEVLLRDRCDRLEESVTRVRAQMPNVLENLLLNH